MKMKLVTGFITSVFIFGFLSIANANTIIVGGTINPETEIDYFDINLDSAADIIIDILAWEGGTDDFFGNGVGNDRVDTMIHLFQTDGTWIDFNDDYNGTSVDGSVSIFDSYMNISLLSAGDYILAIGGYLLSAADAWAGYNNTAAGWNVAGSNYQLTFSSGANLIVTGGDPVPEPATMILFGTGLAGLVGIRRRKKA